MGPQELVHFVLGFSGLSGKTASRGIPPTAERLQLRMEAHETLGKHPWGWLRKGVLLQPRGG